MNAVLNGWAAIVGRRSGGRTRVAWRVVSALRAAGLRVCGVVHEPVGPSEEPTGYDAVDVLTGERLPLARIASDPHICAWRFEPGVFERIAESVERAAGDVVLFEVGPVEARGEGHWAAVKSALEGQPRVVLLSIRPRVLATVALGLPDPLAGLELPVPDAAIDRFTARVAERARTLADGGRGVP